MNVSLTYAFGSHTYIYIDNMCGGGSELYVTYSEHGYELSVNCEHWADTDGYYSILSS